VLSDSPLAYFRLDESSGPTMCDSSASANNGTYVSGVHFGVPGAIAGDSAVAAVSPSSGVGTGGPGSGLTGDHSFTFTADYAHETETPAFVGAVYEEAAKKPKA
jgi:hypothetical protein